MWGQPLHLVTLQITWCIRPKVEYVKLIYFVYHHIKISSISDVHVITWIFSLYLLEILQNFYSRTVHMVDNLCYQRNILTRYLYFNFNWLLGKSLNLEFRSVFLITLHIQVCKGQTWLSNCWILWTESQCLFVYNKFELENTASLISWHTI